MTIVVQFLANSGDGPKTSILRTLAADDNDVGSIIAQSRRLLSSPAFEPAANGFKIVESGGNILYYESRDIFELVRLDLL